MYRWAVTPYQQVKIRGNHFRPWQSETQKWTRQTGFPAVTCHPMRKPGRRQATPGALAASGVLLPPSGKYEYA